jgi:peptidoglycan/LPS O-acetylase OafA/YrhL|tara:strand:- start:169 stop:648 length:480 start_codon:yes stop_codon:yes gene_type:complete
MILEHPIFTEMILPFSLIFVLAFAVLQKSKILGDDKQQIDAMVSLVIGLLLIGVPVARDIVVGLMPWLAVALATMLVFFLLYGFVAGDLTNENMPKNMRNTFGALAALFTIAVLWNVTPLGGWISDWVSKGDSSYIWTSLVTIAVIIAVMVVAVKGKDW